MNRLTKISVGMILLVSEAALSAPKFDEWVYRDGAVERAEYFCGSPQSQRTAPSFTPSEGAERAINGVNSYTLIISPQSPLSTIGKTDITGTFWQLDNETFKSGSGRSQTGYVYFKCGGQKYFAFNVFAKGKGLTPIMRVGVAEDDTSIFKGADIVSDDQAASTIDSNSLFQPVSSNVKSVKKKKKTATPLAAAPKIPLPQPRPDFKDDDEPLERRSAQTPALSHPAPVPAPAPAPIPAPAQQAASVHPQNDSGSTSDMATYDRAAVWHGHTGQSLQWTTLSIQLIRANWSLLSRAGDVSDFCPGYQNADRKQQEICWLRIIGGIVQFESGFRPRDKFRESNGTWSVGLMAMSVNQCSGVKSIAALQQPLTNLKCGITDFAKWTAAGRSITSRHGAARNWSTLRNPYTVYVAGKRLVVGKKKQIESIAMAFKHYS